MLQRILIALDGSTASDAILIPVRPILEREGASAVLLGIAEPSDELADHLARERDHLEAAGIRAEVVLRPGDPVREILEHAREWDPSIVAISTHEPPGVSRPWGGSVAERVLRRTRHPLLLFNPHLVATRHRPKGAGFSPFLVPLDGSKASARTLDLVEVLAPDFQARAVLQYVADVLGDADPRPYEDRYLTPHRIRLEKAGIDTRIRVDAGSRVQAILDAVIEEDAGLVAMASHGRRWPLRWFLGSVAEEVFRHCPCPLLVVPRGA